MSAVTAQISVVIPAYNAESTIREAVDSVLAQNHDGCEIWVIDDASQDATCEVLKATYGDRDDVHLVLRDVNAGPATARNIGIQSANGPWIAFLDGDDAWLPNRLSVQLALAGVNPSVDLWCSKTLRMQSGGAMAPASADADFRHVTQDEFLFHNPVATSTVLARTDVLRAVGGFDEQFVGPEDYDFWMRVASRNSIALIDEALSLYRYVPGSLSMDDRTFLPQVLKVLEKALAPDGALANQASLRDVAMGNQYWNASWMAFNRGARGRALRYWCKAYQLDHRSERVRSRPWFALLYRYCLGRPIQEGEMESMGEGR
ncbi:MAG: glycosyltransferase family A protein [Kiritimatiellae bacterium]|nr:glycosyltransferase family A protein [Kiritimatiellia bacterium]